MSVDARFAGSIPANYEQHLVPVLFAPYAADLVDRVRALGPENILELAAGTGVVSHALAAAAPGRRIVATDLNPAMLAIAARRGSAANLEFRPADAQRLPFPDAAFDLVLAQFGVMFFPDRVAAYREVRRVLKPGGHFLFNVWDKLDANTGSAAVHRAMLDVVPEPKPSFMPRTPFGYHDAEKITADLNAASFAEVAIERVEKRSPPEHAVPLARGMCLGSPLASELALHPEEVRVRALEAAEAQAAAIAASGGLRMSALVVIARSC